MTIKLGLQLYSVRDEMEKDMKGTLKAVKDIGYDFVEFAGYFGKSAEEVRAILDELGLSCISVHQSPEVFFEKGSQKAIDYIKTLGASFCAIPWMDPNCFLNNFDSFIQDVKTLGSRLKENGIKLLYHNHDFEFEKQNGKYLLDALYENVPADLLETELDLCWVNYGGEDPIQYLKKYAGRATVVHIKDFVCKNKNAGPVYQLIDKNGVPQEVEGKKKSKEENGFYMTPVGEGVQDVPGIIDACHFAKTEYLIVEQDDNYDVPSLKNAAISLENLKKFGL